MTHYNPHSKWDHLEKVDKFLGTYSLLKLNHEEIKNYNRPVMSKEIVSVI